MSDTYAHGCEGLLLGKAEELSEAVESILEDSHLYQQLSKRTFEKKNESSQERLVEAIETMYDDIRHADNAVYGMFFNERLRLYKFDFEMRRVA